MATAFQSSLRIVAGLALVAARSDAERRAVEGQIERQALAIGALILNAGTTQGAGLDRAARDAYCEDRVP